MKGVSRTSGTLLQENGGAFTPAIRCQNRGDQFFLTNSDFSFIGPKPSILQSML
ncbi:Uncharacterised protein [Shimwellia blattae]|nr:Uncharacterised protein [Shimwellia blattae]VEC27186.1 Uncharacterised protein [Shimwellia blattae]